MPSFYSRMDRKFFIVAGSRAVRKLAEAKPTSNANLKVIRVSNREANSYVSSIERDLRSHPRGRLPQDAVDGWVGLGPQSIGVRRGTKDEGSRRVIWDSLVSDGRV